MHTIIVCGTPWCKLKAIQQILGEAGVSTARPEPSSSVIDISAWHERLFFDQHAPTSQLGVSKAWELAVSQIFLANWDQPVWGWSDSRSTWLLDFWRDFDTTTHFVLLYTPAQAVLASILADVSLDQFDHTIILDQWCAYQTEMLKFFHRNRNRCILLHADQALAAPTRFISTINQQFQLHLNEQASDLNQVEKINPLDQWLMLQLLQSHPAALALEQEIHACLPSLQDVEQPALPLTAVPAPEAAAAQLRQLYRQQRDLLIAVDRDAQQLASLQNRTQQQQQILQEQQKENELQLVQLHQVQEELEKLFLQNQALQQQNTELALERDTEANAKSEAILARDALAQHHAVQQDNENLHHRTRQEQQQENELLRQQLHQVQEELGKLFLQNQALQQQNTELTHARDAEAQAKNDAMSHHDALEREKASIHDQVLNQQQIQQEVRQENEVLLLQLHQVQEELEHYFLLNQQSQQDKQMLEARWARLVVQYPDYCEWDRIEILDATEESARWLVHGLMATGRTLPPIDVGLDLINGKRELLLYPPTQAAEAPLLYWTNPVGTLPDAPLQPLRLQPEVEPGSAPMQVLRRLAPTDLLRLQTICSALAQGMPATQPDRDALVQHLQDLQAQFKQLPATWRFDNIQLKHEQVNPGYEHLDFKLQNACFGKRQWPEFEFRIAAANVKKGKFSVLPRLEFPLQVEGSKPFENWFNESENENGPKFELRFDIKTNAIDINAWQALNPTDQLQMLSIMASLPRVLSQMEQQGTRISRPWGDWQQLAIGMQKTMQSLGLPASTFEVV